MKKIIIPIILILIVGVIVAVFMLKPKDSNLTKIKVAEVTHSVFYSPQYVAHALGYFEEEGLDVELMLVPGADKVTAAVLSGDVQIGFCGSEASIYVYNQGQEDYLVNFAGLTKRDGSFIVARENIENFTLEDLNGKIEGLIHLEVGIDFLQSDASYDVVLYSELANKEALDFYQNHPLHVKAATEVVKPAATSRIVVDYEM